MLACLVFLALHFIFAERMSTFARWAVKRFNRRSFCVGRQSIENDVNGEDKQHVDEPLKGGHIPVMSNEITSIIVPKIMECSSQGHPTFIDMTFGAGGHTQAILSQLPVAHFPDVRVIAVDRDPLAYRKAQRLAEKDDRVIPLNCRFSRLAVALSSKGVNSSDVSGFNVTGVLFDCGVSSMQFDDANRGFALSKPGPLDMRMSTELPLDDCLEENERFKLELTAHRLINGADHEMLAKILRRYGDVRSSSRLATALCDYRALNGSIDTTSELRAAVEGATSAGCYGGAIMTRSRDHLGRRKSPATAVFQALRIFVNDELNELDRGLAQAYALMSLGGLCCAITFHSLEHRIVKEHFRFRHRHPQAPESSEQCYKLWEELGKMRLPSDAEVAHNRRARSANLRVAKKIEPTL